MYKKNKEQESSDLDEENNSVPDELKEKVEQALVERKENLKERMKAKPTMYKAKSMKTIYESKEEKKKKEKEAKATKRKNEVANLEKATIYRKVADLSRASILEHQFDKL